MSVQSTKKPFHASIHPQPNNCIVDGEMDSTEFVDNILSSIGLGVFQVITFVLTGMAASAYVCESLTFSFVSIEVTRLWKIEGLVYASVPSATSIANFIGQVIISYIADKYGRKWPYVVSMFVVGIFVAASAFSPTFAIFGVLRNIASIGLGGYFMVKIPMLMEFLPKRSRGIVSISTGLFEAFTQCAVAGLAWWLVPHYIKGWRYFILVSSIPSFIAGFLLIFFLESPRYLVAHNQAERAWNTFSVVAFVNGKDLNNIVNKEYFFYQVAKLNDSDKVPKSSKLAKLSVIFKGKYLRRTLCLGTVFAISSCVVYNVTLFLPYYLKQLGLNPYFITLTGITAQIPGLALVAIIVEWPEFGRRNTLRLFTLLAVVFLLLFAFIQNAVATPVFTVLVYFSMATNDSLMTTYISESYPTEIRVMAHAVLSIFDAINGVWFPFVSGYLTDLTKLYHWLSPTFFAGMMAVQLIFTLLLNHETRGRNLEDLVST